MATGGAARGGDDSGGAHLVLGELDLLATEVSKRDVGDAVVSLWCFGVSGGAGGRCGGFRRGWGGRGVRPRAPGSRRAQQAGWRLPCLSAMPPESRRERGHLRARGAAGGGDAREGGGGAADAATRLGHD